MFLCDAEWQKGTRLASWQAKSINTQTNMDWCYSQEGTKDVEDFRRVLMKKKDKAWFHSDKAVSDGAD